MFTDLIKGMIGACTTMILKTNQWESLGKAHLFKDPTKKYNYQAKLPS